MQSVSCEILITTTMTTMPTMRYVDPHCPTHAAPGKCKNEISTECGDVEQGEGKLADCLSDAISEMEGGGQGGLPAAAIMLVARQTNILNSRALLARLHDDDMHEF
eukprot:365130-Chlamydomonas_euryale.AAC.12